MMMRIKIPKMLQITVVAAAVFGTVFGAVIGLLWLLPSALKAVDHNDAQRKLIFGTNGSLEKSCDHLDITPTSGVENAFRELLFKKMVETHPQLSISINKITESGQFTVRDRWDLCREVGMTEKSAQAAKQTLGLDKPPFG